MTDISKGFYPDATNEIIDGLEICLELVGNQIDNTDILHKFITRLREWRAYNDDPINNRWPYGCEQCAKNPPYCYLHDTF